MFHFSLEEFFKVSSLSVQINIIDRLTRPFNLFLERGKLNAIENSKLWIKGLDESLWIMARWLEILPTSGDFLFFEQFRNVHFKNIN